MPKVKTTYAYKIQSNVKEFSDKFMQSINNDLYCNLCNCAVPCNKRFLVDSHRNTSKPGCRTVSNNGSGSGLAPAQNILAVQVWFGFT